MGLRKLIQTSLRFPDCPRLRIHNVTPIWLSEIVYCKFTNCWIMRSSSSLEAFNIPSSTQSPFLQSIWSFPPWYLHVSTLSLNKTITDQKFRANMGRLVKQNTSKISSKPSMFSVLPHIWSKCINPLKNNFKNIYHFCPISM